MRKDLKNARIAQGLTQSEVAGRIGRDQGAVSRYENGQISVDVDIAPKLADVLGLPILQILYGPAPAAKSKRQAA